MAPSFGGEQDGVTGKGGYTYLPTWQRACHWVSGKESVIRGYHPKAGTTPKTPPSPNGPTASRSSLTSDSAAGIICSLSGTEESNGSLCGLNETYLQLLGAVFLKCSVLF